IRQLAREFCAAERAVCYGRIGTSTQAFGGVCNWLINVLNIITGNFDCAGGAMFTLPAFDVVGITGAFGSVGSYNRWQSRVRQLPEFSGELPVSALAEDILTPGEGQIKAMETVAGNPVLSTPNGRQLDEAFAALEFMVAIDIYINETTRHADIILPSTTGLEEGHYDLAFHYLAVRNTSKYSEPLFEPDEAQRHDWEIYRELRRRLEAGTKRETRQDHFKRLRPDQILDLAMRVGPYGLNGDKTAAAEQEGESLKLRTVRKHPHGIDLGPMRENMLPKRLFTPDKKINLAPELILNDLSRVDETLLAPAVPLNGYDLALIGRRDLRSNNSWMHNSERLVKGKNRCTLLMHPEDAAVRGLQDGQQVTIHGRVGHLDAPLQLSEAMMRGVVSLPHGWGHGRDGVQLAVAAQYPGVSLNDLTDDQFIDPLTGNAVLNGLPVTVS
ncbi:MAG: molybdopterin oxidoreductase family protein, partial [Anaerolineales bacterium]|nr:molybdopterin oxidoreductase family protein [Anaerolineales bacterium]